MKLIIRKAKIKFIKLAKKYDGFINVVVDDWRGWRFIFDTNDVRRCDNNCANCSLFKLVKKEKPDLFSAGLYPANGEEKEMFGPQNFLNCKSLKQYQNCYVNFLVKKAKTKKEIVDELNLIIKLKMIFSKNYNKIDLEKKFKKAVINRALVLVDKKRRNIIQESIKNMKF